MSRRHPPACLQPASECSRPAMLSRCTFAVLAALAWVACCPLPTRAGDWPMYRYDANRSAASPEQLAATLHLQWVRDLPPLKPAWAEQPKLQLDAVYEPVVAGKLLFVASSRYDTLTAYDT